MIDRERGRLRSAPFAFRQSILKVFAFDLPRQPPKGLIHPFARRIKFFDTPPSGKRSFGIAYLFEDQRKTRHRAEVARFKRQRRGDILKRLPIATELEPGRRAAIIGFGEPWRVVDDGREMLDRTPRISVRQRLLPSLKKQVHRRTSRLRPEFVDAGLDLSGPPAFRPRETGKEGVKLFGLVFLRGNRRNGQNQCRNERFENAGHARHIGIDSSDPARDLRDRVNHEGETDDMSETLDKAVTALNEKMDGEGFDGNAKFVIEGEGAIIVDEDGARIGDEDAEVTMTADADTFEQILDGSLNPTSAFMSGRLSVDGDMSQALKLGAVLS